MELFGIGWMEMLVIALVALIVVGPQRLPHVARNVGQMVSYAMRQWRQIQDQIRQPIEGEVLDIQAQVQDIKSDLLRDPASPQKPDSVQDTHTH